MIHITDISPSLDSDHTLYVGESPLAGKFTKGKFAPSFVGKFPRIPDRNKM
jgi:hypothetical protein